MQLNCACSTNSLKSARRFQIAVTQKDIARHLGISRSTVAQALTDIGRISPETRASVFEAARKLGYRPNFLAQALVTGKTNNIAFWYSPSLDPHSMHIINGLDNKIRPYKLQITNVLNRESGAYPDEFPTADWPVDGVFAFSVAYLPDWILNDGKPNRPLISMVYDAFPYRPGPEIDTILIKIRPACEQAMRYLVQTRQRVAFLCVDAMPNYGDVRYLVYKATMLSVDRPQEYILAPLLKPIHLHAWRAILDYVKTNGCPDAIFCGSDEQAVAAHGALHELGYRVPEDVALIGNDGLANAEYHVPPLSTIAQPYDEIIFHAWEFLQKRLAAPDAPRQYIELEAKLVLRESSKAPEKREI